MKKVMKGFALAMGLAGSVSANAAVITYSDFSDVSGLQLNGTASKFGDVLRLTSDTSGQAGSAFSTNAIALSADVSFSAFFSFNISGLGGFGDSDGPGADGLVFTMQTVSNTAGTGGGGIGFEGLGQSLGVEFDTWDNGTPTDPNGNHVGVNLDGNVTSVATVNEATRFNNGSDWFAWIDYDGTIDELSVRYSQAAVKPTLEAITYNVDLTSIFGSTDVFVGFTSGTGSAYNNHDINSFSFSSDFDENFASTGTPAVSAPGSFLLLMLSTLGLIAYRRK
ncbi:L-type lectin-domain containing protein [Alteromonas gilva]|uniref:L-type lectin-domain containing protein n=1 Tax=Alteromonas gilva TaxID=2987522 RepID=A0ABT5KX93_9ALTE|nr:L-type lectin-domain containing protein [Alteromonas gilva]MDC8829394.1 L-type lectin-domain containing protein [Alteromonas gilva]